MPALLKLGKVLLERSARALIPGTIVALVLATSWFSTSRLPAVSLVTDCGYLGVPAISSVSPNTGPTTGDTYVAIFGCGFTGTTSVKFGDAKAIRFTVNSSTEMVATSPAHAAGTVDVRVTTGSGTSAISLSDRFTYSTAQPCTPSGPAEASASAACPTP